MKHSDIHRDAVLRQLGVTYYESLHGAATAADVSRALESVKDTTSEHAGKRAADAAARTAGPHARGQGKQHHHGRWHHRVGDVMTTPVVTAERQTAFKEIAVLMAEHKISAVPVVVLGRHVAGVVSEADLLSVQDRHAREAQLESGGRLHWHTGDKRHLGLTAGELMTSPAITIHPDATLPAAARLMNSRHLKRLPVVQADTVIGGGVGGKLIGIVSRCDLLSVFLRPDEDIAREVREMLTQILLMDPASVTVRVRSGIVTLDGKLRPGEQQDLIRVAGRLTWDIDGVVDVMNKLGADQPITPPSRPHSEKPSGPGDFVTSAYDFAEQLLTSQRNFAERVFEVTRPLLGGRADLAGKDSPAGSDSPAGTEGSESSAHEAAPAAGEGEEGGAP